jgi:hypothetical protein
VCRRDDEVASIRILHQGRGIALLLDGVIAAIATALAAKADHARWYFTEARAEPRARRCLAAICAV